MMYILHGNAQSTTLARVVQCFLEMGLKIDQDFKIKPLDWMTIFTDEYALDHQPFKQMPYLLDEDTQVEVYESRSIVKYVATKTKSPLHVTGDLLCVTKYETACSFELANFSTFAEGLTWELKFKQMFAQQPADQKIVDNLNWFLKSRLEGYERLLSRQKYVAGEKLTLVDLFHVANGYGLLEVKEGGGLINANGKSPNLARWWKEISERPSWQETQGILQAI